MRLSERLNLFSVSPTLALTAKAAELRANGVDIISFAAGEPDFSTPEHVQKAAIRAMHAGETKYTAVGGTPQLKKAICSKLLRDNDLQYGSSEVTVSCGAKQVLFNAFLAILNQGDEVIVPSPYWVSYVDQIALAGGKAIVVPSEFQERFKLSAEKLSAAITPRTKILLLNSPSNPSGSCYSREELSALGQVLNKHKQIMIFSDDIYEKILYDDIEFWNLLMLDSTLRDRFLLVNGVSKCYSMTGWRIGYAAGPEVLIKAMEALQSQVTSSANSIAQAAAVEALQGDQTFVAEMNRALSKRRSMIAEVFAAISEIQYHQPQGAFYAFPNIEKIYALPKFQELRNTVQLGKQSRHDVTSKEKREKAVDSSKVFSQYLLESANVAVVPGIAFGDDGCVRLSFALSDEELGRGLQRIAGAIEKLRGPKTA